MTDVTEDWLLNEAVKIYQPVKGYRAGLDALLLSASLPDIGIGRALEVGCGAGGALFTAAWHLKDTNFVGLERESLMADLARCGVEGNGFSGRVEIVEGDLQQLRDNWENAFDLVFSNPPYFEPGKIQPPILERSHAYLADVALKDWLKFMLFTARPKGRITLIHRAGCVDEILSYLRTRSGQIEVFPVFSSPDDTAKRVIVTARKGLRQGEVKLHRGLVMHPVKGEPAYTEQADKILKGAPITALANR